MAERTGITANQIPVPGLNFGTVVPGKYGTPKISRPDERTSMNNNVKDQINTFYLQKYIFNFKMVITDI